MRVLITRPIAQGKRTAALLEADGHECIVSPLLEIETLEAGLSDVVPDAIAVTSSHAAAALAGHAPEAWKKLPVAAVGGRTAEACRAAGFTDVHVSDGGAEQLAWLIGTDPAFAPTHTVFYPHGRHVARDLAALFAQYGKTCRSTVVYEAAAAEHFTEKARTALLEGTVDAVLLYSQRSAAIYAGLMRAMPPLSRLPAIYGLSPGIVDRVPVALAPKRMAAAEPEETQLRLLLLRQKE